MARTKQTQAARTISKPSQLVADLIAERDWMAAQIARLRNEPRPKPVREIINRMVAR